MYEPRLTNIAAYWDNAVHKLPRAVAAIWGGRAYTYEELDDSISRTAAYLKHECGFGPGDRLAIALPNCLEFVIAYWAALRLGGIVAPINTHLRADELQYVIGNIGPKALVVHDDTWEAIAPFVGGSGRTTGSGRNSSSGCDNLVADAVIPGRIAGATDHTIPGRIAGATVRVLHVGSGSATGSGRNSSSGRDNLVADAVIPGKIAGATDHTIPGKIAGATWFSDATGYGRQERTNPAIQPADPAVILHTSGTTGQPKGALMTHETLIFNVRNGILAHSFRHEDVHLLAIPCFAPTCSYTLLAASAYLGSGICIAPRPNVNELIGLVRDHGCTTFIGVPTLFHLATNEPGFEADSLPSLRLIAYSGSPMPARTIKRLREGFPHVSLHNFFGLTETISITHVLPSKDAAAKPESIGKALPEVYTKIIDDRGNEVGPNEVGELCFRRENIIPGYWNRPGLLDESISDEWFRTGDYAYVDEEGFFYVQGRKKEMIIVAGQNVYALEVEGVILKHDGVREVAVVGVPATGARAALGELVKAVVVPQLDTQLKELDIKRHCAQFLPSYKVPQIVEFREELPKNPTGKVLKREL
jgi:acyl-CoA synthetase (AMP-forming)/AMP-acid ligase II